jgi:hypothetical protein
LGRLTHGLIDSVAQQRTLEREITDTRVSCYDIVVSFAESWGIREELLEIAKRGLAKVFELDFDELEKREPTDRDVVELAEIISIMKEPEGEA